MNKKNKYVLYIVEGRILDVEILLSLSNVFFNSNMKILVYGTNIYRIYSALQKADKDEFFDVVEILKEKNCEKIFETEESLEQISREQISEIYMFFDWDGHNYQGQTDAEKRACNQMQEMLEYFDNETEEGKLYISYPMVEAINHTTCYREDSSEFEVSKFHAFSNKSSEGKNYKIISKQDSSLLINSFPGGYSLNEWKYIIKNYMLSFHFLCKQEDILNYNAYVKDHIALETYLKQYANFILPSRKVVVMSCFPQFLIDYKGAVLYNNIKNEMEDEIFVSLNDIE